MIAQELLTIFRALPPGPFTVHVADKPAIEVVHKIHAAPDPTGAHLKMWDRSGELHRVNVEAITRIEPSPR